MGKPFYGKYLCALLIGIIYFLFHMHFMQRFLDWDQVGYYRNVQRSLTSKRLPVYNPHHLHLEVGSKYFHLFMKDKFGDEGFTELLFNNRIKSLLAASLGIFFAVLFFTNITGRLTWGIAGSLLIGLCHGFLVYATKFDTGIFPGLGIIMYFWIFERMANAKKWLLPLALAGGGVLFTGIMFHQFLALACINFVIVIALPPWLFSPPLKYKGFYFEKEEKSPVLDRQPARRYQAALLTALIGVVLTIGAYFWTGKTQYDLPFDNTKPKEERSIFGATPFQLWLFSYATVDSWGKGIKKFNPVQPFRGYTDGFISRGKYKSKYNQDYHFRYDLDSPPGGENFTSNILAYFTFFTIGASVLLFPILLKRYRRIFLFLMMSLTIQFIFSTYWEPYYLEFWIVPVILNCILFILILNLFREALIKIKLRPLAPVNLLIVLFFTIVIGVHNLHEHLVPYSRELRMETANHPEKELLRSPLIYKYPEDPYKMIKPK